MPRVRSSQRKKPVELTDEAIMIALKIGKTYKAAGRVLNCDPNSVRNRKQRYMARYRITESEFDALVRSVKIDQSKLTPRVPKEPTKKHVQEGQIIIKDGERYVVKSVIDVEGHVRAAKMKRGLIFWRTPEYLEPNDYEMTSEFVTGGPKQCRAKHDDAGILSDTHNYFCY